MTDCKIARCGELQYKGTLSIAGPVRDRGGKPRNAVVHHDRMELKFVLVYSVVIIFTLEGNFIYTHVFD